ncbi:MAG: DUF378 domain-containing protein [Dehalococcoidales bacterium]|nr:DUF378 domain-containing protein [Dehalococcoidales bacterium]
MRNISRSESMMSPLGWIAGLLAVIGALNWGLVGLFNFNLVRSIFGPMSMLSRLVYTIVGISGLYLLFSFLYTGSEQTSQSSWLDWMR